MSRVRGPLYNVRTYTGNRKKKHKNNIVNKDKVTVPILSSAKEKL